jgi:integrase
VQPASDSGLIFDRGDGAPLPLTTWQRTHAAIITATGVYAIGLHDMRHTNATLDLEAGVHPKIVAERLGHASTRTTLDRYSHVSIDLQQTVAEAFAIPLLGWADTSKEEHVAV